MSTLDSTFVGSTDQTQRAPRARLFLAHWPAARERAALVRHQQHWLWSPTSSPVRADRLHLTLHFIGALERKRIEQVAAGLHVPRAAFELALTRPELWSRGIAVLRPTEVPDALRQLHARLGHALRAVDLPVEARPFRPHVTLARGAAGAIPPAESASLRWAVNSYVLVESTLGSGGGYRILRHYSEQPG